MLRATVLLAATLLVGCGQAPQNMLSKDARTFDVMEAAPTEPATVARPRIAYTYTVTYAFDRRTVGQVQGRQLELCRQLGSTRCLIVKSTLNSPGPDDHIVNDEAVLLVVAELAGEVNRRLDALAVAGGATLANRMV